MKVEGGTKIKVEGGTKVKGEVETWFVGKQTQIQTFN